ncbi:MAG TPA: DUF4139 domain-containing protein [Gemmatimonadota bacterium]|nr:DUF4139 domain-containing protein [Gemmatimonadota bacterium]
MKPAFVPPLAMLAILSAVLSTPSAAHAQVTVAPALARTELGVTVYNGFAVLRETRALPGGAAANVLWPGVPASIDPGTVVLRSGDRTVEIRRQDWQAPLSSGAALAAALGSPVTLIAEDGTRTEAVLESGEGPTFRVGDRVVVEWPGAVELPAPPDDAPGAALRWELAEPAGPELTAAYLADGLTWAADYTAVLDEDAMTLDGFITVENGTGLAFPQARLQLVAGEVRRAGFAGPPQPLMRMTEMAAQDAAANVAPLGDVYLYTIDRPVTITALGSNRIALLHSDRVPVEREYVLYGQPWWYQSQAPDLPPVEHPQVRIRFVNDGLSGADEPLPAGALHTWREDGSGRLQYSGGAQIPHTPAGEEVVVTIGSSFDLVAERVQTDYRQLDPRTFESAWRIEIRNRGESDASVLVVEQMPGLEWTIVEESAPHEQVDVQTVRWTLNVPAEGSATLTYRVRVTQG